MTAAAEIVAVKVTDSPKTLGLADEATEVVVRAGMTTWPPSSVSDPET